MRNILNEREPETKRIALRSKFGTKLHRKHESPARIVSASLAKKMY